MPTPLHTCIRKPSPRLWRFGQLRCNVKAELIIPHGGLANCSVTTVIPPIGLTTSLRDVSCPATASHQAQASTLSVTVAWPGFLFRTLLYTLQYDSSIGCAITTTLSIFPQHRASFNNVTSPIWILFSLVVCPSLHNHVFSDAQQLSLSSDSAALYL